MLAVSTFERIGGYATVIAVGVALVSLAFGYYWYRQGKRTRTMDWIPRGLQSIVMRPVSKVSDGLKLTWNNQVLETPYTVRVRIQNTGAEAIEPGDYLSKMTLDFGDSVCYEATFTGASDPGVQNVGDLYMGPRSIIEIDMKTMNARDWFDLSIVADGHASYPLVTSRIKNESRPTADYFSVQRRSRRRIWVSMLVAGLACIAGSIIAAANTKVSSGLGPAIGLVGLAGILLFTGTMCILIKGSVRAEVAYRDRLLPPSL